MTNVSQQISGKGNLYDYGLLILLAAMFGASFMLTKISVQEIPPATLVAGRLILGVVILHVAMQMAGQGLMELIPHWKPIVLSAFFGNALPFFLISWGQELVDAGLTAILMATMPLITLVLAHFLYDDERLNLFKVIGFCLGITGVITLIGLDKMATLGDETIRQYAIAFAAMCYAVNSVVTRKLTGLPRRATGTALLMVSFAMVLPFALYFEAPWNLQPSLLSWFGLLMLGIFPTAIGTLLIFAIIKRRGAAFFSQINFLVPVSGVLWAIALLNESLPVNAALALLLILFGLTVARINFNFSSLKRFWS